MIQNPFLTKPLMVERKCYEYLCCGSFESKTSSLLDSNYVVDGDIAIIQIHGFLSKRSGIFDNILGFTSYEHIRGQLDDVLSDKAIKGIILDIDSPGGEVSGLFDLADYIYAATDIKPIWAVANDDAYSAAYALASSASKVFLSRTGGVGSIGVIASHVDQSSYDEKQGLKYTAVYAGDRKNDLNPHEEIKDEALSNLQSEVNRLYKMFTSLVARNRAIAEEHVIATQAGCFFAEGAINNNLADGILTLPQVTQQMHKITINNNRSTNMEKTEPQTNISPDVDYKAEMLSIIKVCEVARDYSGLASFVERGLSADDVKDELLQKMAGKNNAAIQSHVTPVNVASNKENPLITAAKSVK